jgi:hypothetical protein
MNRMETGSLWKKELGDECDHEACELDIVTRGIRFEQSAWNGEVGAFDDQHEVGVELGVG